MSKTLKEINDELEKAKAIYVKQINNLRAKCKHQFTKYAGYAGTDYKCDQCGYWK